MSKSSFTQVATAWVPPLYVHRVFANIMVHMETRGGVIPNKAVPLIKWELLDDRGGSGHYQIRFEPEVTLAQARLIVGKGVDVSMEDY